MHMSLFRQLLAHVPRANFETWHAERHFCFTDQVLSMGHTFVVDGRCMNCSHVCPNDVKKQSFLWREKCTAICMRGVGQIMDLCWSFCRKNVCTPGCGQKVKCQLCRNHGTEVHRLHDYKGCVESLCCTCSLLSLCRSLFCTSVTILHVCCSITFFKVFRKRPSL